MTLTATNRVHFSADEDQIREKLSGSYPGIISSKHGREMDLMEACKKGDPGAQLKVCKLYYRQMFEISRKLVGDTATAHEIVRESFMLLFERMGSLKGQVDFTSRLRALVEDGSLETRRKENITFPALVRDDRS